MNTPESETESPPGETKPRIKPHFAAYALLPCLAFTQSWDQWLQPTLVLLVGIGFSLLFVLRLLKTLNAPPRNQLQLPLIDSLDSMSEGIFVTDTDGKILLANQSIRSCLGSSRDEQPDAIAGRNLNDFSWQTDNGSPFTDGPWRSTFEDSTTTTGLIVGLEIADGGFAKFITSATVLKNGKLSAPVILITLSDVTAMESRRGELLKSLQELKKSQEDIRQQNNDLQQIANRDPLTGCRNRRGFFEAIDTLWRQARRYHKPLACLMIDIDHFKSINDTHGHSKGDEVLAGVSATLKQTFRDSDIVCRYGGEEFCIILPEQELETAILAADRCHIALSKIAFGKIKVTVSIGVAERDESLESYEELIDRADQALYSAKRTGRNQTISWPELKQSEQAPAESKVSSDDVERGSQQSSESHPAESTADESGDEESSIPLQAVTALVSALGFRDPVTAEHSSRVAALSVAIGGSLMSFRELRLLETAALLHDIGKIGVPDSILLKPGQLTDKEWKIMHRQERIGVEIVRSAFASSQLTQVLKTHGAQYSGTKDQPGMPTGKEIPLAARIISVCNAFDAMTHDRTYRKGMSAAEAYAELRRHAGDQFDPDLVEQLIDYHQSQAKNRDGDSENRYYSAIQLGSQIEQIAEALEELDLPGLHVMSTRLAETAHCLGVANVATAATELVASIDEQREVEEVLKLTKQLLDICQFSQQQLLGTPEGAAS